MQKEIYLHYQEYKSEDELPDGFRKLVDAAKEATNSSYSPYSKFKVGAALLLDNDEIIAGNNQENAAYPSGLCAERVTVFYANAKYPKNVVLAMAIAAANSQGFLPMPITPCGSCRQVLLETEERYNQDIPVILYGTEKIFVIPNIKALLPFFFDKETL